MRVLFKMTLDIQYYKQGIGAEPPWIQSQVGAGEPTAKNGVAQETWSPGRSTVSAICTVAVTVQESLWKLPRLNPPPPPPPPPPYPAAVVLSVLTLTVLLVAAVVGLF